jgi:hypothetical protein
LTQPTKTTLQKIQQADEIRIGRSRACWERAERERKFFSSIAELWRGALATLTSSDWLWFSL